MAAQTPYSAGNAVQHPLLVEDFKHWSESFWKNETSGEQRVQLYVGFVTAVLGGIAALAKRDNGFAWSDVNGIGVVACGWLSILGLLILSRMLKRNDTTDKYHHAMDHLRFVHGDGAVNERLSELGLYGEKPPGRRLFKGGLVDVVGTINTGVAGVGGWFLFGAMQRSGVPAGTAPGIVIGLIAAALMFALQVGFILRQK